MMFTHKLLAAVSVSLLIASAAISAEMKPTDFHKVMRSDADMKSMISQGLFEDEKLSRSDWQNVEIQSKDGDVTLTGKVAKTSQIKVVEEIARRNGAKKISNHLTSEEEAMNR